MKSPLLLNPDFLIFSGTNELGSRMIGGCIGVASWERVVMKSVCHVTMGY